MGYTIGQFAGMHRVSKKTLRYYRDIGLLEPANIDPVNGYAFYEVKQLERMRQIQYLRRLRFSLEEIRDLLQQEPKSWRESVQAKLAAIRSEKQSLEIVEHELSELENRVCQGKGIYTAESFQTQYRADVFELPEPLPVIGRAARVPYNHKEEKMIIIEDLISSFYGNDEPGMIPQKALPTRSFGLVCECEKDMSVGTYMMGMQVNSLSAIPEGMRSFILPAGLYARITFQAGDRETLTNSALEGAYDYLYNGWLSKSGYRMTEMLAVEVYEEDRLEVPVQPEMELWQPVALK
ncbi:MerR family transcriptional regulator [Gorillibacterium massiliense]|uniref:MerR family transcriptional regulator n=1 Tax=Gorillibacterium massiliense TaxID=1280390 RepID=UPI0004ADECE0|nr:MerR family transcriptional regulator [Gorillibacterium massiliense]